MNDQLMNEISAIVAFSLLLMILRLFWGYHVDALRERLFALRDEMMIYAFDEEMIENPAYRNLRVLMNGLIRYAHKLSFANLMLMALSRRYFGIPLNQPAEFAQWKVAVAALPFDQQTKFKEFHQSAILLVTKHMVLRSPLVWAMAAIALAHVILIKPTKLIWDATAQALEPKMHIDLAFAEALKMTRM